MKQAKCTGRLWRKSHALSPGLPRRPWNWWEDHLKRSVASRSERVMIHIHRLETLVVSVPRGVHLGLESLLPPKDHGQLCSYSCAVMLILSAFRPCDYVEHVASMPLLAVR